MQTGWLQEVVEADGPFASVHLDVTRDQPTSAEELRLRWAAVRQSLLDQGAPQDVVGVVEDVVLSETGLPGEQGRTVIAGPAGVVLDRILPRRPVRDSGSYGPVPHLMPLVRGLVDAVPYAVVEVDAAGADVTLVDALGQPVLEREIEGGHDVLHKFGGGGWSHRRFQMRVEDSWERNAAAVADGLDRVVAQHRPALLLLAGDPQVRSLVHRHATGRVAELLTDLESGGRAEGVHEEAFQEAVEGALRRHRQAAMGELLARYTEHLGRDDSVAHGLPAVVEALRAGAVDVLLLADDPSSTERLWAGDQPLQIGRTEQEVAALGSTSATSDRADAVLLRALVAQRGDIELVEGTDVLDGGVGALLRFDVRPPVPGRS
ncbi:Vms1/Ankzf1 family peptidyl-tRNA hydrolase [Quadrisphaera sp. GCM10027208]|uniref:baeRF2 domain-containing protein n=1 Tax=Quadrisphaera sp. GCM10027208 TaxID=3273423 RepID=UPI00360B92DE